VKTRVPPLGASVLLVFTANIANGLTAGPVPWPGMKLAAGRAREINGGSIALAAVCLLYYAFGLPH